MLILCKNPATQAVLVFAIKSIAFNRCALATHKHAKDSSKAVIATLSHAAQTKIVLASGKASSVKKDCAFLVTPIKTVIAKWKFLSILIKTSIQKINLSLVWLWVRSKVVALDSLHWLISRKGLSLECTLENILTLNTMKNSTTDVHSTKTWTRHRISTIYLEMGS